MPTLFDQLDAGTVADRFRRYHAANPGVYLLFKQYAADARAAGHTRYSARDILARIRWHTTVEVQGEFKVNNLVSPFYARMLVAEDALFAGFFEMRAAAADATEVSE